MFAISLAASLIFTFSLADQLSIDTTKLIKTLLSICLGLFISVFATNIQRTQIMDKKFDEVKNLINENSTRYLGQLDELFRYLELNGPRAAAIYNTRVIETDNVHANIDHRHMERIVTLVSKCINNGVDWSEIISDNGLPRVQAIRKQVKSGEHYTSYKIKNNFPIFNFVYLEHSASDKQIGHKDVVIFGFGYNRFDDDNELFVSNDPKLLDRFYNLFKLYRDHYSERIAA